MSLKEKTILAIKWNLLSTIIVNFMGIFSLWILSHLLSTTDYGVMSSALIISTFVMMLLDFGISNSIIRSKDLNENELSSLFFINVFLGVLSFLLVFSCSNFFSGLFHGGTNLSSQIKIISFGFLFIAFSLQPKALLTREMDFTSLSKISIFTNALNYIVVLTLCYIYRSSWCIAFGFVISMLFSAILSNFFARKIKEYRFSLLFKYSSVKQHLKYGLQLVSDSLVNQISINTYPVLMSRLVSISAIGGYNLAYSISISLFEKLNPVLSHTLFPAFSKISSDEEKLKNTFLNVTTYSSLINFPLLIGVCMVADEIVSIFFDSKWIFIIPIVKILSITGAIRSLDTPVISVLLVKAKMYLNVRLGVLKLILGIPLSFYMGKKFGIVGISLSFLIVQTLNTIFGYFYLLRQSLDLSLKSYIYHILIPILHTLPIIFVGELVKEMLVSESDAYKLFIIVASCLMIYILTLLISTNSVVKSFKNIIINGVIKIGGRN